MIKICLSCNKSFNARLSRIKYCSDKCAHDHMKGNKSSHWKGGEKVKICEFCGKEFSVRLDWFGVRKYCSKACYTNGMRKRQVKNCLYCNQEFYPDKDSRLYCSRACSDTHKVKENHSSWKGGKSYEPYPPTFDNEFKRMIRERDNNTCALCKCFGDNVHHINYVKMDTQPKNCITLCRSCHAKTNSNREYWQEYFTKLMQ